MLNVVPKKSGPLSLHIASVTCYHKKNAGINQIPAFYLKNIESTGKNILASMFLRPAQCPYA